MDKTPENKEVSVGCGFKTGSSAPECSSSRSPAPVISEVLTVRHGVPQGSAVGPLSFCFSPDHMDSVTEESKMKVKW